MFNIKHKNAKIMIKIPEGQDFLKDQEGNQKFTMVGIVKIFAKKERIFTQKAKRDSVEGEGGYGEEAGVWPVSNCRIGAADLM